MPPDCQWLKRARFAESTSALLVDSHQSNEAGGQGHGTCGDGVDPHKASNTAVVIDGREQVQGRERFVSDRDGYRALRSFGRGFPDRTWAVEGARGIGAGLAQGLVADGELDVPAELSARVRALGGGSGRKTADADAYAVAVAGLRSPRLQLVAVSESVEVLRLLTSRRSEIVAQRIATVNRLHDVLLHLVTDGAKRS